MANPRKRVRENVDGDFFVRQLADRLAEVRHATNEMREQILRLAETMRDG